MQVIAAHTYDLDTRSRISTVRRVKAVTGDRGTAYTKIIQALA